MNDIFLGFSPAGKQVKWPNYRKRGLRAAALLSLAKAATRPLSPSTP
jgi:hypothetical protein